MTGRIAVLLLFSLTTAFAQINTASQELVRRVRVRVALPNHAQCDPSTRVVLNGNSGFTVTGSSVNNECVAEFTDLPATRYRVSITGANITNADDGEIEIDPVIMQDVEVRARYTHGSAPNYGVGASSFVSVRDLAAPSSAAKEFDKAEKLIAKQDWTKALERLRKGLAIYPEDAAAYNNLGAVYSHMGNTSEAREALKKALALDDHLSQAYVNLGRLSFLDKDYPAVESLLNKALTLAAQKADVFTLLAYAQLSNQHFDQAIATGQQAHSGRLDQHAYLHVVAANAYEQQKKIGDSISQLELYLNEEPTGWRADKVREALATLQARVSAQAQQRSISAETQR